jgi:hypothetical protein
VFFYGENKMSDKQQTEFQASWSVDKMRDQANKIAREQGLTDRNEIDAFRHAYVSAKVSEATNPTASSLAGQGVEWIREGKERWNSNGERGNPKDEWAMDIDNNKKGIEKEQQLDKLNLPPEEKERRLREEIDQDVKNGKLQTQPSDTNQKYYPDKEDPSQENETPTVDEGTLDDSAALEQSLTQASKYPSAENQQIMEETAKAATGRVLSRMHGVVLHEVENRRGGINPMGGRSPVPMPDEVTQKAIQQTLQDPRNQNTFKDIAQKMAQQIRQGGDVNPNDILVSAVLNVLKGGNIRIRPNILIPDIIPQSQGGNGERSVEIGGVNIPVRLPQIELPNDGVIHESGSWGGDRLHRDSDGVVRVKGYTRDDGTRVGNYTRSAPSR